MLLEDMEDNSKLKLRLNSNYWYEFSYTEIWSSDETSKYIKLAEPKLTDYYHYPELMLVDTKYCVNP